MSPHVEAAIRAPAPLFAALGDETRLKLVKRLSTFGPQSITRLCTGADVTRQAISKHLRVLEDARLVRAEKIGRETIWELDARRLSEAKQYLDQVSAQWDAALQRLAAFVEESRD